MRIFTLLLVVLVMSSCASFSKKHIELEPLNESNYSLLNGTYSNKTEDQKFAKLSADIVAEHIPIYLLTPYKGWNNFSKEAKSIQLKMLDDKTLELTAIQGNQTKSWRVKGKLEDGYFLMPPQFRTGYFPPFMYVLGFKRSRVGILKNKSVIVESQGDGALLVAYVPIFSGGATKRHECKKIDE